jgi:hypothetical protein
MKYYENLAQNLINQRNNAKRLIEHTEIRLKESERMVELQTKLAESGKENTLAFEKAKLSRIELELRYANDALNAIIDEIEIQSLAANLKQNEPQSISVLSENATEKKFYNENDFTKLVKEILDLDYIRIDEFLEFHFSKSFGETITDKMNWLTMLRKHILWLKKSLENPENIDTVPKIGIAEIWEKQKRIAVYNDFNNRKTETPPPTDTEEKPNTLNKFNKLNIDIVQNYFMQLAENQSKNESSFLSKEEVKTFIDRAFNGNNSAKKVTINASKGEKTMVWRLFYNFFNDCTMSSEFEVTKQGNKEKYVRLLTDNITNWEYDAVFNNFSKSNTKYWKRIKDFTQ